MLKEYIKMVVDGKDLTAEEMGKAVGGIMEGSVPSAQVGSFLTAMRMKGETGGEIAAAARVMRERGIHLKTGGQFVVDTCGTGGDGRHTFNISTAAAIVAAASGVKVAKHGNRAVSSSCGSADVLSSLGVNIQMQPDRAAQCLQEIGMCFCFAPIYHSSMKNVAEVRKDMGIRTLFNILGPLANPARAEGQVLGVYDPKLFPLLAEALILLGCRRALLVHGSGLDEISVSGATEAVLIENGSSKYIFLQPDDFGLQTSPQEELVGGDGEVNARLIREVLAGSLGACRDAVVANAAAAIFISGIAMTLAEGAKLAAYSIDSGRAEQLLNDFAAFSQG